MSARVAAPMASTALDLHNLRVRSARNHVCAEHVYPAAWTHLIPMSRPIDGERDAPMDPPTKRVIDTRYTTCRVPPSHSVLTSRCCRRTLRPLSSLRTLQRRGTTPCMSTKSDSVQLIWELVACRSYSICWMEASRLVSSLWSALYRGTHGCKSPPQWWL